MQPNLRIHHYTMCSQCFKDLLANGKLNKFFTVRVAYVMIKKLKAFVMRCGCADGKHAIDSMLSFSTTIPIGDNVEIKLCLHYLATVDSV